MHIRIGPQLTRLLRLLQQVLPEPPVGIALPHQPLAHFLRHLADHAPRRQRVVADLDDGGHMGMDRGFDAHPCRRPCRHRLHRRPSRADHPGHRLVKHRLDQLVLAFEMIIDAPGLELHLGRDRPQRGAGIAAFMEQPRRGIQHAPMRYRRFRNPPWRLRHAWSSPVTGNIYSIAHPHPTRNQSNPTINLTGVRFLPILSSRRTA